MHTHGDVVHTNGEVICMSGDMAHMNWYVISTDGIAMYTAMHEGKAQARHPGRDHAGGGLIHRTHAVPGRPCVRERVTVCARARAPVRACVCTRASVLVRAGARVRVRMCGCAGAGVHVRVRLRTCGSPESTFRAPGP